MAAVAEDDSTLQSLHEAARSGNSRELLAILEIHPEFIDSKDSQGQTSLMLGSDHGHHECVEKLLKLGANPCIPDVIGWTCLHFAAYMGHIKVLEIILRCPNLAEFVNSLNNRSGTALLLAVQRGHSDCVKEMLRHEASPWMIPEDLNGRTCLHYAAEKGYVDVVRELVEFCPLAKFLNFQGGEEPTTAATLATKFGQAECLEVMLEHKADPFIVDGEGWNCLHYASNWGHLDMVKAITAHTPEPAAQFIEMVTTGTGQSPCTALRLAVEKKSTYCLRPLLEKGANPFAYAWDEWSCLHLAARAGQSTAVDLILEFHPDQKDLRTKDGESTALMLACSEGHWDVVETLLKYKVDILACNTGGFNCLHLAAEKGHIELIKSLLLEDGDEDYSEEFRYTRGCMVDKLHKVTDSSHRWTQLLQLMNQSSSDEKLTPLHMAAIGPGGTAAVLLLEKIYRILALKTKKFLVDPTSILFEYLSKVDPLPMNFTLQASRKRFNNSLKKFMLRAHVPIPVELLSNHFDGEHLGKFWQFGYQGIETGSNQETETEETEKVWREKFESWVHDGDPDVPVSKLCSFGGLADAYVAVIRYMNAKDCVGRTALHYLAGPYDKHPVIEDVKDVRKSLQTFEEVFQIPTLDVYALDNHQYSALHLAANSGNSIMIEAFAKLEYVTASVAFTNLEYTADSPRLSGGLLQKRRQIERNVKYSRRAHSIKDPKVLLMGLLGGQTGRRHGYEPEQGSCLAFLWAEEREGLIALHYAVDRCDKTSVRLLVEANRVDLLVRTNDNSCASPFTIALSKGPQMYADGGKWVSKHNLLCPSLHTLVFNFEISNRLLDTTLFEMLEQAALEYDPADHRDFLRIWVELIWSMRELQQQRQIPFMASQKEELVDQMEDEDHYEGLTILHYAAFRGRTKELKHLLGFDKLANMVNKPCVRTRQTFLHFAVIERKREVVDLFCKSDETSSPLGESRRAPLKSISDIVRWNDEDRFGRTPYELVLEMISMADALTRLDIRSDRETIRSISALKQLEASLRRDKVVGDYIDKQFRDRQIHVDAGNTALVGAALIASVTFAGWLQPPLGYTAYEELGSSVTGSLPPEYAAVRFEVVRIFWIFNSLSFFFAVATVVCGARAVLPAPSTVFIAKEVRSIRQWLVRTSLLLVISITCVLGAFGAAGFAVLPPEIRYWKGMAITTGIGGTACVAGLIFYFFRLNKIGGLFRVPRRMRKWYVKRRQGSTMWTWSNEPMDDLKREQKLRLFGHQAPDSSWINVWNNISNKRQKNDTEFFDLLLEEKRR